MHQFRFIGRRHHHEIGQICQIGDVKTARMGGAIGTNKPRAINRKAHRQTLYGHVMHNLIIAALQEGRIKRAEGF